MFNYLLPQMQRELEKKKVGIISVPERILSSVQTEILKKRGRLPQVKTSFSDTGISPLLSIAIFPSKAKRGAKLQRIKWVLWSREPGAKS